MKWVNHQLTAEQAQALLDSKIWIHWTPEQIVRYQLFQIVKTITNKITE